MDRRMYLKIIDKHPHMKNFMSEVLGSTTYAIIYRTKDGGLYEADLYNSGTINWTGLDPDNLSELEYRTIFAHRVRTAMKAKNMMQKELAEKIGVSKNAICWWLSMEVTPSIYNAMKIAKALDIPMSDFEYKWNAKGVNHDREK